MIASIVAPMANRLQQPLSEASTQLPAGLPRQLKVEGDPRFRRENMLNALEHYTSFPDRSQKVRDTLLNTDWGKGFADRITAVTLQIQTNTAKSALDRGNFAFRRAFDDAPPLLGRLQGHADAIGELSADMDGFGSPRYPQRERLIARALDTFSDANRDAEVAATLLRDKLVAQT